jgi:hypothetical protein
MMSALGAWVMTRGEGDLTHVMTLSLWPDMEAIKRFAGAAPEVAKYYEFDAAFLTTMEPHVLHWACEAGT